MLSKSRFLRDTPRIDREAAAVPKVRLIGQRSDEWKYYKDDCL